jgi:hypothetical protein
MLRNLIFIGVVFVFIYVRMLYNVFTKEELI